MKGNALYWSTMPKKRFLFKHCGRDAQSEISLFSNFVSLETLLFRSFR
jgi:hypothetical protein